MTHFSSVDFREVIFINERCRVDYGALPDDVKESADEALQELQNGRVLPPKMFGQLHGTLRGVDEIILPFDDDTYRVYVDQDSVWVVVVLDAGIKKSPRGSKMPVPVKERLEARLQSSRTYLANNSDLLRSRFDIRAANLKALQTDPAE